ncbi:PH domain-containing protein [Pseudonocardiaceae bacterium YIM PH 21723]|nr:PH domain-containing protein [Pseudonocardiaceae bacterium YIM PH 21723]
MAYPEDLLADGEFVVIHKHPHWKMLFWPVLSLFIVLGVLSYAGAVISAFSWHVLGWAALGVLGLAALIGWTFAPILRWQTTHFVLTSQRVMYREGMFTRRGIDIPMSRVNSVQFRHSIMDRIFGCGTLIVESASEEPLEFDDIPNVEKVHTLLYRQFNDNPHDDFTAGPRGTARYER